MKGIRLNIFIRTWVAVLGIGLMTFLAFAPSWSQYALTANGALLIATLGLISGAFDLRAASHPKGGQKTPVLGLRHRQLNRLTAYAFLAVASTPVTLLNFMGENATDLARVVNWLHYPATGLAIASAYASFVCFYERKVYKAVSIIGAICGIGIFAGSFTGLYSVAIGEAFAAVPLVAWVLTTNKTDG